MWDASSDWGMQFPDFQKTIHAFDSAAAYFGVPGALVMAKLLPRGVVERGQQVEGDVGRLVIGRVGGRDVMAQRADGRLSRELPEGLSSGEIGVNPSGC